MDPTAVTIRPRFVWGRRPRANGGRRRPRGREGFYKYPAVVSRGSYPVSTKLIPPTPRLEEFPLVLIGLPQPSGVTNMDYELVRLSVINGMIARIRRLLLARAEVWVPANSYREVTKKFWRVHDSLLTMAEQFRMSFRVDFGVDAPLIPDGFYSRF